MSAPFKNNSNNKKQDPPVNKLSKINVDIANVVAKNKNQFVVESEGPTTSTGKSFLNNRPVDDYGRGAPTDRLTFGYAPSVAAEAVAFHSRFSAKKWKIERRLRYKSRCLRTRAVFLQEQASLANGTLKQTGVVNFEPDTSAIKLRLYWIEKAEEERKLLSGGAGGATSAAAVTGNEDSKTAATNKNDKQQSSGNQQQQQQQGKSKTGGDGSFSKLLSDMFGGEFTNTNSNNEGKKESGQRRQREE